MTELLEQFMRESNWIEGERESPAVGKLNLNDMYAAWKFLDAPLTAESLKALHFDLSEGRNIKRGEWRDCQVYVGDHVPPAPEVLDLAMENYFEDLVGFSSYTAHCEFEKIHPFEDLNGRTGRLIWLHRWRGENPGRDVPSSFLQQFYYQSLSKFRS